LLYETFALIREVSGRQINMRHYDVQLMGGWVMIKGQIAQMQTGEGKTLVATLPACVAAMSGMPVHVITVNDYLVERDAQLMTPIYHQFGLTVGIITEDMDLEARQASYACDITYCSNKQLTFDYLKDKQVLGRNNSNLQLQLEKLGSNENLIASRLHLRGLCFAIVDEADSVLVDESRTPLILSREVKSSDQQNMYEKALEIAAKLRLSDDFIIDQRNRMIDLTLCGSELIEQETQRLSGVWSAKKYAQEMIVQALSAKYLFLKDVHYLVKDDKVVIVDEFTGRVMPDRSWEAGLHQLIEIKEGCEISGQKETLAKISYQTFFRRYLHLSGMTGTAKEIASELFSVYQLMVIDIPTHKPVLRQQLKTRYFSIQENKWQSVLQRIKVIHNTGRPILVGTRSVEASEYLAHLLSVAGLNFNLLNARHDENEAEIIKLAGADSCITLATNMAGRGTDIGLSAEVNEMGGLHVIATECHESKRIDQQLFGRCGRQGNQGSYEMYLSLDDEISNKYTADFIQFFCQKILNSHLPGARFFTKGVFSWAQYRAQAHNAAIRANLFKMDSKRGDMLAFSGRSD
ncbi:MAG: preprotein translocase subunit SecA, partial [Proteobacteria bacterium]|nr:preprotein translocase subunit SecA [Pseudomonadota bacterium]